MTTTSPLKRAVKRILFYRLSLTVIVIALVFAGVSYYHSKGMITHAVIQATKIKVNVIRGRYKELMKQPETDVTTALQDAVNYPPDNKIHLEEGEFIYALLHSENRESIGSYEHPGYSSLPDVKQYLARTSQTLPDHEQLKYNYVRINGKEYLDIHSKLTTGDDGSAVYLRAFFALSDQTIHVIHKQAIQVILYVIGLVLLTALLLYPVIAHLINKLADYSTGLLTAQLETMEALGAAIAKRDSDTDIHNYRVTIYAVAIGEKLLMDTLQIQRLIKGAFLHDVGKIGVRDNILLTKAKLDEREFAIMQKHVQYGLEIIKESRWLRDAEDVVACHHEKYDGSGYPNGLKAEQIPLTARIFALVDVFDALTSRRPYKKPFSYEQTMQIMEKGRGIHFDPVLLDVFEDMASQLYQDYAGREDNKLKAELLKITDKYFQSGIDTLLY